MKLSPDEYLQHFSHRPLQRPNAKAFLEAVKLGDVKEVQRQVFSERYLIFEVDHFGQTALHWAAKRNHLAILEFLINQGSMIDAKDILGRTALFQSVVQNQVKAAQMLVLGYSAPYYVFKDREFNCIQMTQSLQMQNMLTRAMLLRICLKWVPKKQRWRVFENEGLPLFDPHGEFKSLHSIFVS